MNNTFPDEIQLLEHFSSGQTLVQPCIFIQAVQNTVSLGTAGVSLLLALGV